MRQKNVELIHDGHSWHLKIYQHTIWVTEDDLRDIVRVVNNGIDKKDLRTIDAETTNDAWHIDGKAITYTYLHEQYILKGLIKKLQDRVATIEEVCKQRINR